VSRVPLTPYRAAGCVLLGGRGQDVTGCAASAAAGDAYCSYRQRGRKTDLTSLCLRCDLATCRAWKHRLQQMLEHAVSFSLALLPHCVATPTSPHFLSRWPAQTCTELPGAVALEHRTQLTTLEPPGYICEHRRRRGLVVASSRAPATTATSLQLHPSSCRSAADASWVLTASHHAAADSARLDCSMGVPLSVPSGRRGPHWRRYAALTF
jgi:hypothetical protein